MVIIIPVNLLVMSMEFLPMGPCRHDQVLDRSRKWDLFCWFEQDPYGHWTHREYWWDLSYKTNAKSAMPALSEWVITSIDNRNTNEVLEPGGQFTINAKLGEQLSYLRILHPDYQASSRSRPRNLPNDLGGFRWCGDLPLLIPFFIVIYIMSVKQKKREKWRDRLI